MAGWIEWESIPFAMENSMAKTILETTWPSVITIARAQGWTGDWVIPMQVMLAGNIVAYKSREFPTLSDNPNTCDAILAGELFASANFHQNVARFDNVDAAQNWMVKWAKIVVPTMVHIVKEGEPAAWHEHIRALRSNDDTSWDFTQLTWARYLFIYYKRITERNVLETTTMNMALVHYVCGLSHMGHATAAWMNSRVRAIRLDMADPDLEMNRATLERVWDFYGCVFKPADTQWAALFYEIHERCKEKKLLRLQITSQQAAEQGFAVVKFVSDAIMLCSDFNWTRFEEAKTSQDSIIKSELSIWKSEMTKMVENPFTRFAGATGITNRIPNLGFLAKELLGKTKGVQAVEGYAGLNAANLVIPLQTWVTRLVNRYIAQVREKEDRDAEKIPAMREDTSGQQAEFEKHAQMTNPTLFMPANGTTLPQSNAKREAQE